MSQSAPDEDDDVAGHETEDPRDGTHASADVVAIDILDNVDAAFLGRSNAEIDGDYSSSSDATILGLGGDQILGSSASSDGEESGELGPVLACEESDGALCLGLLFADSSASESNTSSKAKADTALVFVCVGGDNPNATGAEDCGAAPVTAGVFESHSAATADKSDGSQSTDAEATLLDVCLGPDGQVDGICSGLGVEVLTANSSSSIDDGNGNGTTKDDTGQTDRSSSVLNLQAGGANAVSIADPDGVSLPPDCPTDPGSLLCLFINQGESFTGIGEGASRQEALHLLLLVSDSLPGGSLLSLHAGTAETRVVGMDAECPPGTTFDPATGECVPDEPPCPNGFVLVDGECRFPCPPDGQPLVLNEEDCPGGGPDGDDRGGGLAVTGAGLLPLVAVSMILAASGTGALATERRRRRK